MAEIRGRVLAAAHSAKLESIGITKISTLESPEKQKDCDSDHVLDAAEALLHRHAGTGSSQPSSTNGIETPNSVSGSVDSCCATSAGCDEATSPVENAGGAGVEALTINTAAV